jgi:hypothetical protein
VNAHDQERHLRWLMRKGYVEVSTPWSLDHGARADIVLEMARRDPEMSWSWMHVPANGDWHSLTVTFAQAKVCVGGGWTAREGDGLIARVREVLADTAPLPPAPFAYQGWRKENGIAA